MKKVEIDFKGITDTVRVLEIFVAVTMLLKVWGWVTTEWEHIWIACYILILIDIAKWLYKKLKPVKKD